MTVHCFTSFTFGYLSRARILATSIKKHHPDWILTAVVSDVCPDGYSFDDEPFDQLVWSESLYPDLGKAWFFKHNVVEMCTAVKGRALRRLLDEAGCEKVLYFDPDIAVFSDLDPILSALDRASIVLTPHQIEPEDHHLAICDNEIASLQYGTFNLGFVGVRNDDTGRAMADWWASRLDDYCHDNLEIGLFVDQKWFNLVPCFFEGVEILRHPGYNVASWNISRRRLKITGEGDILVNERPLGFYHFTKIGGPGDIMTRRYAAGNSDIHEIWAWYRLELQRMSEPRIPPGWWKYGYFDDGQPIEDSMRRFFRTRNDLQEAFGNPFLSGPDSFQFWLEQRRREVRYSQPGTADLTPGENGHTAE